MPPGMNIWSQVLSGPCTIGEGLLERGLQTGLPEATAIKRDRSNVDPKSM